MRVTWVTCAPSENWEWIVQLTSWSLDRFTAQGTAGSVTNTRNLTSLMSSNSFYDFNVSGECDELILEFFKIN
jgi:hypothetical protein